MHKNEISTDIYRHELIFYFILFNLILIIVQIWFLARKLVGAVDQYVLVYPNI